LSESFNFSLFFRYFGFFPFSLAKQISCMHLID
jgi:hypothetical protein